MTVMTRIMTNVTRLRIRSKAKMSKTEIKDQLREREVDQISKELNPNIQSFVPKQIPAFNASQS